MLGSALSAILIGRQIPAFAGMTENWLCFTSAKDCFVCEVGIQTDSCLRRNDRELAVLYECQGLLCV